MALHIRDDRVRELPAALAERQGCTMTEAVRRALLDAKARLDGDLARRDADVRAALAELRPELRKPAREAVLYDEDGQPIL